MSPACRTTGWTPTGQCGRVLRRINGPKEHAEQDDPATAAAGNCEMPRCQWTAYDVSTAASSSSASVALSQGSLGSQLLESCICICNRPWHQQLHWQLQNTPTVQTRPQNLASNRSNRRCAQGRCMPKAGRPAWSIAGRPGSELPQLEQMQEKHQHSDSVIGTAAGRGKGEGLQPTLEAGNLELQGWEPSKPSPCPARQRPAAVSQTGRSWGQQCCWSLQHTAFTSGQQAQDRQ